MNKYNKYMYSNTSHKKQTINLFFSLFFSNTLLTFLCVFIFKFFIDLSYLLLIVPIFGRFGDTSEIFPLKIFESYALLGYLAFLITKFISKEINPSRIMIFLYFISIIVPMSSLYGFQAEMVSTKFMYMVVASFSLLVVSVAKLPKIKVTRSSGFFFKFLMFIFSIITLYVYGFLMSIGGIQRINFNLSDVYLVREELRDYSAPLINYFIPWDAYIINMTLLVLALYKRSYKLFYIVLLLQLFLFGMTNFKSFLFAPILVIFIFYFGNVKKLFLYLLMLSSIGLIAVYLVYQLTNDALVPAIFLRRLFFLPAQLHFFYYDFFSQNSHVLLSNNMLSFMSQYPYNMPIPELISSFYIGKISNANTGYLADAFAQFGFVGMIVFSFILAVVLRFVDSLSKLLPIQLSTTLITIPSMTLVNSALFTTLLTHGFILAILTTWTLSSQIVVHKTNSDVI